VGELFPIPGEPRSNRKCHGNDVGESQFDPRVDDRYFQHDSDDEVWPDPPTSDEFEPEEEPLRL
jgi:hypothetical protein